MLSLLPGMAVVLIVCRAHRTTSVGPLPSFISEKTPALYDEIDALQFQQRMTAVLY
jgi:hypothetical protein